MPKNIMFCATIIPTIGREKLTRAVESVLSQDLPAEFEIIVVNDSGRPLAEADWQRDERVRVIHNQRRERSAARNSGAAIARAPYLHFLDDDDWLAPHGLRRLWELAQERPSAWLYGSSQLVDRDGRPLIQLHHKLNGNCFLPALAGEWIPLQASLIDSRLFFEIGGFNPLLQGPEDIDLLRRVALRHDLAGVEAIVAYIERGDEGSATDYGRHPEQSRWAREKIVDAPETFARLRHSLNGLPPGGYWPGRISRLYLTSLVWNLRRGRGLTAVSRAAYLAASLILAGPRLLAPAFWRSLSQAYASPTFAHGWSQLES